jgi:GNAT superfamily N-acetyltransferase
MQEQFPHASSSPNNRPFQGAPTRCFFLEALARLLNTHIFPLTMKVNPRNIFFSSTFGRRASASRTRLAILSLYAIGLPASLSAAVYPATLERLLQLGAGTAPGCRLLAVRTTESGRPHANRHISAASAGRTPDVREQDVTGSAASPSIPIQLGWANFRHCVTVRTRLEEIRGRLAPRPQWYLMALGVEPSMQQRGLGAWLIEPILDARIPAAFLVTSRGSTKRIRHSTNTRIRIAAGNIPHDGWISGQ